MALLIEDEVHIFVFPTAEKAREEGLAHYFLYSDFAGTNLGALLRIPSAYEGKFQRLPALQEAKGFGHAFTVPPGIDPETFYVLISAYAPQRVGLGKDIAPEILHDLIRVYDFYEDIEPYQRLALYLNRHGDAYFYLWLATHRDFFLAQIQDDLYQEVSALIEDGEIKDTSLLERYDTLKDLAEVDLSYRTIDDDGYLLGETAHISIALGAPVNFSNRIRPSIFVEAPPPPAFGLPPIPVWPPAPLPPLPAPLPALPPIPAFGLPPAPLPAPWLPPVAPAPPVFPPLPPAPWLPPVAPAFPVLPPLPPALPPVPAPLPVLPPLPPAFEAPPEFPPPPAFGVPPAPLPLPQWLGALEEKKEIKEEKEEKEEKVYKPVFQRAGFYKSNTTYQTDRRIREFYDNADRPGLEELVHRVLRIPGVAICGGYPTSIVNPLEAFDNYTYSHFMPHDIDIFIYRTDPDFDHRVTVDAIVQLLGRPVRFTPYTINFPQHHYRKFQVIKRLYNSVTQILSGFDVDCSACAITQDEKGVPRFYGTDRFIQAVRYGINVVNPHRQSTTFNVRLNKYMHRGFVPYIAGKIHIRFGSRYMYPLIKGGGKVGTLEELLHVITNQGYAAMPSTRRELSDYDADTLTDLYIFKPEMYGEKKWELHRLVINEVKGKHGRLEGKEAEEEDRDEEELYRDIRKAFIRAGIFPRYVRADDDITSFLYEGWLTHRPGTQATGSFHPTDYDYFA